MPRLRRMSRSSIESLEQRIVPSVTVLQTDLDSDGRADDLKIVGGNEGSKIKITDEGIGQGSMLLDLDINGDGDFADVGDLQGALLEVIDDTSVIELQLGGGNDQVEYSLSGNLSTSQRRLSVDLGKGNDRFAWLAPDRAMGSNSVVDIDLLAGAGNDEAFFLLPSIFQSSLQIDANMGAGNDKVGLKAVPTAASWIDLQSTLDVNVELGSGVNNVDGFLFLSIGTLTKADVSFDITGGTGIDHIDFLTQVHVGNGTLSSTFNVNAELSGGNDYFNHFISQLDVQTNSVHSVRASGGSGNDVLNVQTGANSPSQLKGQTQIDFIGGAGNDRLLSDFDGHELLLQGGLRVNLDGQDGVDTIEALLKVTASSTGLYSLVSKGGAGKDAFLLGLDTNGAALTLGLDGTLVIDGGQGIDQLQTTAPESILEVSLVENFV